MTLPPRGGTISAKEPFRKSVDADNDPGAPQQRGPPLRPHLLSIPGKPVAKSGAAGSLLWGGGQRAASGLVCGPETSTTAERGGEPPPGTARYSRRMRRTVPRHSSAGEAVRGPGWNRGALLKSAPHPVGRRLTAGWGVFDWQKKPEPGEPKRQGRLAAQTRQAARKGGRRRNAACVPIFAAAWQAERMEERKRCCKLI